MKNMLALIMATLIVGFGLFAISYWLLNFDRNNSLIIACSGALAGFAVEILKPSLQKLTKKKSH